MHSGAGSKGALPTGIGADIHALRIYMSDSEFFIISINAVINIIQSSRIIKNQLEIYKMMWNHKTENSVQPRNEF